MNDCVSIISEYAFETKTKCVRFDEVGKNLKVLKRGPRFRHWWTSKHLHPFLRVLPERCATSREDFFKRYGAKYVPLRPREEYLKYGIVHVPYFDFRCEKCDVVCNGQTQLKQHLAGRKHNRVLKQRRKNKKRRVSREYRVMKKKQLLKQKLLECFSQEPAASSTSIEEDVAARSN